MHTFTIVWTIIATWVFGWLSATFGVLPSLFAAIILYLPSFAGWRLFASTERAKRRQYFYVGLVAMISVVASSFTVFSWYASGMDRLADFEREYYELLGYVASSPEYRGVEVTHTRRKGGRLYLQGHVADEKSHTRLIQLVDTVVRSNDSGYYDGVEYPGKPEESPE